jgi:hypothetical protein
MFLEDIDPQVMIRKVLLGSKFNFSNRIQNLSNTVEKHP